MSAWSIIIAILILGVLVTVHELGHFWVARLLKIKAYEVAIFVGPKLVDWRKNDVEYSIRAIPFGAYVRFNDLTQTQTGRDLAVIFEAHSFKLRRGIYKPLTSANSGANLTLCRFQTTDLSYARRRSGAR